MKEIVLSGIRPTGNLHLGNYYGAVQNFIKLQDSYNCYFFIADYHSLTTHPHPDDLHGRVKQILVEYLAAGLDPEKATLYVQSDVPEVVELYLFLNMNAYIGELERVTTFKEKVRKQPDNVNAGLLTLGNAIGVIMGANIGTTITGVLVALKNDVFDMLMYFLAFAGVMMGFFKKEKIKLAGTLCCGLGLIFVGLNVMSSEAAFGNPLVETMFQGIFSVIDFPLLLILVGVIFTALTDVNALTEDVVFLPESTCLLFSLNEIQIRRDLFVDFHTFYLQKFIIIKKISPDGINHRGE